MPSKKASPDNEVDQPAEEGQPALDDLEAHISQRINQLQSSEEISTTDLLLGATGVEKGDSGVIPHFEPFEGYEFATLHSTDPTFSGGYEKVRDVYQESGEVIKTIHSLTDLLTESLVNLNVRLNDLEGKLKDISEVNNEELRKLKLLIREVHKSNSESNAQAKTDRVAAEATHSMQDYMNELQKQVTFLKERMDRNVVDMGLKIEERQTAFLNMLDTRVKVLEKISIGYKDAVSRNFFNLAVLLILIVVIAGTVISISVDRMSSYVSQGLDALRTAVRESLETAHTPSGIP
jgi:hypothetical protein